MALAFPYPNTSRAASDYMGRQLFRLKEAMVSAGWTVVASGDGGTGATRFAYNGTPPEQATGGGSSTLTDTGRSWTTNQWQGGTIEIVSGTGSGQSRTIASNTATVITTSTGWTTTPDATSVYKLSVTAATPGSGGNYDVWVTGNARNNSTPVTAGDAGNALAWCLLQCGTTQMRQVLLQMTSGTGTGAGGYSGYCSIVYTPLFGLPDTYGMRGADSDANKAPPLGTYSYAVQGGVDSIGSDIGGFNTAGYYHIWYDDAAVEDGAPAAVGMVSVDTSSETPKFLVFGGLEASTPAGADDPFCVCTYAGTSFYGYAWNPDGAAVQTVYEGLDGQWQGAASTSYDFTTAQLLPIISGQVGLGVLHRSAMMQSSAQGGGYGDRGTDQNGLVFVFIASTYGLLVPWVAEATAPLPGTNSIVSFYDVAVPSTPSSTTYYDQKVWDTGTSGWCYYTKTTIDASPLSGDTVPNWTGSISTHVVVGERTA